jgi:hypothetical protein
MGWVDLPEEPRAETPSAPPAADAPDKYQEAAIADRARLAAAGYKFGGEGYSGRIAQGAGLGWTDEIMAGLGTIPQMIRQKTLSVPEAYRYSKAEQDLIQQNINKNTEGPLGTALEIGGGLGSAGGVLAGTRGAVKSAPAVYATNIGKGVGLGAFGGAGYADTLEDVPQGRLWWYFGRVSRPAVGGHNDRRRPALRRRPGCAIRRRL